MEVHAPPAADIARVGTKHNHGRRLIGGDQRLLDREPVAVRHAIQPVLDAHNMRAYVARRNFDCAVRNRAGADVNAMWTIVHSPEGGPGSVPVDQYEHLYYFCYINVPDSKILGTFLTQPRGPPEYSRMTLATDLLLPIN